jgi:hypothetical protein
MITNEASALAQGIKNGLKFVLFKDGSSAVKQVYLYQGAALVGQATAYVMHAGKLVWVKPGQSVSWVQAVENE